MQCMVCTVCISSQAQFSRFLFILPCNVQIFIFILFAFIDRTCSLSYSDVKQHDIKFQLQTKGRDLVTRIAVRMEKEKIFLLRATALKPTAFGGCMLLLASRDCCKFGVLACLMLVKNPFSQEANQHDELAIDIKNISSFTD